MLLRDRLPTYISWEQFTRNQEQLEANNAQHRGPARPVAAAGVAGVRALRFADDGPLHATWQGPPLRVQPRTDGLRRTAVPITCRIPAGPGGWRMGPSRHWSLPPWKSACTWRRTWRPSASNCTATGRCAWRGPATRLTGPSASAMPRPGRHPQTVNRAVSFNVIKNEALALLLGGLATGPLLEKLTALFLTNPCLERKGRNPPRKKSSARALLDFHKRQKKHCF